MTKRSVSISLSLAIGSWLFLYQPKIIPGIPLSHLEEFVYDFDARALSPERQDWPCKEIEDIRFSTRDKVTLALRRIDREYEELVIHLAMKIHNCHIQNTDGVSFTMTRTFVGRVHPFIVALRRITREVSKEQLRASAALEWINLNPELLGNEGIYQETVAACLRYQQTYDNFSELCSKAMSEP